MKIKKYKRKVKNLYILLAFKYIKIQNLKLGNRYIKLQKGKKVYIKCQQLLALLKSKLFSFHSSKQKIQAHKKTLNKPYP